MNCKQCGTEIADKAIVCYRCGAATADPVHLPPAARSRRSSASFVLTMLALLVIGAFAVYASRTGSFQGSGSRSWVFVAFAVVIVALRGFARRMRR